MIPKFRAWDKENDRMVYTSTEDAYFELTDDDGIVILDLSIEPFDNVFAHIDAVVMQSTGLKDKNDVEIFEGDIVLENGMEQVISLGEQRYEENFGDVVYYIGFNIFTKWGYSSIEPIEHEVIGNIYENPELLNLR